MDEKAEETFGGYKKGLEIYIKLFSALNIDQIKEIDSEIKTVVSESFSNFSDESRLIIL